jgi:hypothetical protein
MNTSQSADVMMFRNVAQFLAQNAAILEKSANLKEDATDFQQVLAQLEAKIDSVNATSQITAQDKVDLRNAITQEVNRCFSIIHRHALKKKNAALQKATDIKPSAIKQMTDADFMAYCNQMTEIITDNAPILTTALVPSAEQNKILQKIQLFKTVKPQIKLNTSHKSVQNEDVDHLITQLKTVLKKMLDASVLSVQGNDPDFVREYKLNRERRAPVKTTAKKITPE